MFPITKITMKTTTISTLYFNQDESSRSLFNSTGKIINKNSEIEFNSEQDPCYKSGFKPLQVKKRLAIWS